METEGVHRNNTIVTDIDIFSHAFEAPDERSKSPGVYKKCCRQDSRVMTKKRWGKKIGKVETHWCEHSKGGSQDSRLKAEELGLRGGGSRRLQASAQESL